LFSRVTSISDGVNPGTEASIYTALSSSAKVIGEFTIFSSKAGSCSSQKFPKIF
jgi:hypothetical protein